MTNHHIRSPLLNAQKSCTTCHSRDAQEMIDRAYEIQETHHEMLDTALDALVEFIQEIKRAQDQGIAEAKLERARNYHSRAQFIIDFIEAENSMGFHAPQESGRVLLKALDMIRKGSKELSK